MHNVLLSVRPNCVISVCIYMYMYVYTYAIIMTLHYVGIIHICPTWWLIHSPWVPSPIDLVGCNLTLHTVHINIDHDPPNTINL